MAIANHEYVGKMLELLTAGLEPFVARELAYRLYAVCERRKRAAEALAYNALVQSWPEITRLAREAAARPKAPEQGELL